MAAARNVPWGVKRVRKSPVVRSLRKKACQWPGETHTRSKPNRKKKEFVRGIGKIGRCRLIRSSKSER